MFNLVIICVFFSPLMLCASPKLELDSHKIIFRSSDYVSNSNSIAVRASISSCMDVADTSSRSRTPSPLELRKSSACPEYLLMSLRGGGTSRFNAFQMDERRKDSSEEDSSSKPASRRIPTRSRHDFSEEDDKSYRSSQRPQGLKPATREKSTSSRHDFSDGDRIRMPPPRPQGQKPAARIPRGPESDGDTYQEWRNRNEDDEDDEVPTRKAELLRRQMANARLQDNDSDEHSGSVSNENRYLRA
jgi:hypothetical protein